MSKGLHTFRNIYVSCAMFFLYAPIFVLILFSFNQSKSRSHWTGFTFDWYQRVFSNEKILTSLWNTIIIAVITAIVATIIGTIAAIGINAMKKWQKNIVMNMTYVPILNPEIVTGVSLMLLFVSIQQGFVWLNRTAGTNFALEFGFVTLLLAHISFSIPYVILNVLPKLRQQDRSIYEAALDLGCSPLQAFIKVVIPDIMPGILAGMMMAFTLSLDDFVISYFVTGPTVQTLPIEIYTMTRKKVSPEINALSTIIFLVVMTALIASNYYEAKKNKQKQRQLFK